MLMQMCNLFRHNLRIDGNLNSKNIQHGKELLERIALSDRMNHRPSQLSGGQNQRVAIARSLVDNPRIVFADEPTGALNYQTSLAVYNLMREMHQQQKVTFVIVTHERELAAKTDRILSLLDGKVQNDKLQKKL